MPKTLTRRPDEPRPLRVLMTADAVGGVWQYALDLAGGLAPHGVETTLAVFGPAPSRDQAEAAQARGVPILPTGLPLEWTAARPEEVEEAGRSFARLAGDLRPDIIHLNSPALAAEAAFPAPVIAVCHSCVASWWEAVCGGRLPEDFRWRTDLVRRGYDAADALVAPTKAFAEATARLYGLDRLPQVVRNGRSASERPNASGDPATAVFTAGRLWDEGKNLATLDRAAARLPVPVRAAGPVEGPNGSRIELRHVAALGRLTDAEIAAELAAKPIFVSAARYEPFGLAVLEAAQAGCALVLSDIPTFRELWDGAAAFVPAEDDAAIASAVESLLNDPEARARFGRRARVRSDAYTVDAMSAGLLRLYRSFPVTDAGAPARAEAAA